MFAENALKAQMVMMDTNVEELSKLLGMNPVTFYRKMNEDGRFTRGEIEKMINILQIKDPESIFFAPELASGE